MLKEAWLLPIVIVIVVIIAGTGHFFTLEQIRSSPDDDSDSKGTGDVPDPGPQSPTLQRVPLYKVFTIGGVGPDQSNDVALDEFDNVYMAGQFSGSVDFDPTKGVDIHTSQGGNWDIFITKINSDNNYGWTITIGGNGAESARAIALSENYIYVAGEFVGPDFQPGYSLDFDPTEGIDIHTSQGSQDLFVMKLHKSGSYVWTKSMGGNFNSGAIVLPYDMTVDSVGDVITTGTFIYTVDFDPGPMQNLHVAPCGSLCEGNTFITKLSTEGLYAWTRSFGGLYYETGHGIDVDSNNNIFASGDMGAPFDVPGFGTVTGFGGMDVYVTKLSPMGQYMFFKVIGGPGRDLGRDIVVDGENNVLFTGLFSGTADMNPGEGVDLRTSNGGFDIFLTKLANNGDYIWSNTLGGRGNDWGKRIKITYDKILLTGMFRGTVDFDPSSNIVERNSGGGTNFFVERFEENGNFDGVASVSSLGWNEVMGLDSDARGDPILTGWFQDPVDFDPTEQSDIRIPVGNSDIFIWKLFKLYN